MGRFLDEMRKKYENLGDLGDQYAERKIKATAVISNINLSGDDCDKPLIYRTANMALTFPIPKDRSNQATLDKC